LNAFSQAMDLQNSGGTFSSVPLGQNECFLKRSVPYCKNNFPLNTMVNHYWLPVVRAYLEIRGGHPAQARKLLEDAIP
jgi:hypothetical protein